MRSFFTSVRGWLAAVIVGTVFASVISTQRVIGALNDAGTSIELGDRFSMTGYDLIHFGTLYGLFILLAFLVAFLVGGILFRMTGFGRGVIYEVAGAVAMLVMLLLMQSVFFGVPIVGGARDGFGLALQMLAGGVGGYAFHRLTKHRARY